MRLKTAICDDDINDVSTICQLLKQYEMNFDVDFDTACYTKSRDLLDAYSHAGTYDVLFLDVEMPDLSGLDLAKTIRDLPDRQVRIIFISNYPKYMQNSFQVHAFHYLEKPINYASFCELMHRLIEDYHSSASTKLLLCSDLSEELVHIDDIIYIETNPLRRGYLTFVLKDRKISVKGLISEWSEELTPYFFLTPHKGFLVNINHIHYIEKNKLILSDNLSIPLSRKYEQNLRNMFTKHILTIHHHR